MGERAFDRRCCYVLSSKRGHRIHGHYKIRRKSMRFFQPVPELDAAWNGLAVDAHSVRMTFDQLLRAGESLLPPWLS